MAADNDLEPAALSNLKELQHAVRATGLPVAVQLDRSASYARGGGNWQGARRFCSHRYSRSFELTLAKHLSVVDSASPEHLRSFLEWGIERLPARHTLVILWGHGRGDRGLLQDEGAGTVMSIDGLARALRGLPIDVLALDLCSMQTLEVAAALDGRARFLVGSQTPRHALGWPYSALLDHLGQHSGLEPRELAEWLVEHAGDRGGAFTGSAVDLQQVAGISATLAALQRRVEQHPRRVRDALAGRISRLPLVSRGARSVDFGAVLDILAFEPSPEVTATREAYSRALLSTRSSPDLSDASGLSIRRSRLSDLLGVRPALSSEPWE